MLNIQKASAGSGKTFTLARDYIRLLIGRTDTSGREVLRTPADYGFGRPKAHGAILAVTFTNKATEEMTQRIVKELYLLAHQDASTPPKSDHAAYFMELYGCSAVQLARAARRALADLLFNFSWFNVSTIDSFFQNIVRVFARDLDLPDNYTIEIEQEYPVMESVRTMLDSVNLPPASGDGTGRHSFLISSLRDYMRKLMNQGNAAHLMSQSSHLNQELVRTINKLINEDYKERREVMDSYLADPERMRGFYRAMSERIDSVQKRIADGARAVLALDGRENIQKYLLSPLEKFVRGEWPDALSASVTNMAEGIKSPYKGKWAKNPEAVDPVVDRAVGEVLDALKAYPEISLCRFIRSRFYPMVLFGYAVTQLEEYCRDNESFLLGDTTDLLKELIGAETDAPFIYERTGSKISHYLIDEFQDTSKMQWHNFSYLVLEALANGERNLIIGDEKQSIYRFRNAQPELLGHKVEEQVRSRFGSGEQVEVRGTTISQNTNWRSAPEIVLFNNSLFKAMAAIVNGLSGGNAVEDAYRGLVQQVSPAKSGGRLPGYVEVSLHRLRKDAGEAPDDRLRTLVELTEAIKRQLTRGYSPRDIAILVRSHQDGRQVIDHLLETMKGDDWELGEVRIMSSDALEVGANPTVMMVVNMLQLLSTPDMIADVKQFAQTGETAMVANPEYMRRRLVHRFRLWLCREVERSMPDGSVTTGRLTPSEALARAIDGASADGADELSQTMESQLASLSDQSCPNLYELVESIIQTMIPPEQAAADIAFITTLQDQILDFMENGPADLASFLKWFSKKGRFEKLSAPDGLDAITVTTIHQAKGLEYDCVHLPFFSAPLLSTRNDDIAWYPIPDGTFLDIDPKLVPPMIPLANTSKLAGFAPFAAKYDEFCEQQRLDRLNVAYVACTRPVRELNIYASISDSKSGPSVGSVMAEALMTATEEWRDDPALVAEELRPWVVPLAPNVANTGEPGGELIHFTLGNPTAPVVDNKKEEPGPWAEIPEEPLAGGLLDDYKVFTRKELSISEDFNDIQRYSITDERRYGIFLHDVLSHVNHLADLPAAMRRAAYRARLTPAEEAAQLKLLQQALADERVRPWFEGYRRVVTERPASTADGVRRPDRLVWLPSGEVCVIDYKFGAEKSYFAQIQRYMQLMADMGYTRVKGYIWYPLTGVLKEVPQPR